MTDIWATLWGFWDAGKVDPFALTTCFPEFIKKIRAEGDKLKEKAEKFDRYNLHKISLEENGVWGAINKLDAKIETIKKLTDPFIEWGGPCDAFYRVRLHKHPELQEYVSELMKILYPDVQSSEKTEEVNA